MIPPVLSAPICTELIKRPLGLVPLSVKGASLRHISTESSLIREDRRAVVFSLEAADKAVMFLKVLPADPS